MAVLMILDAKIMKNGLSAKHFIAKCGCRCIVTKRS